ncbi:type VI secretion system tip protein VgrG [Epibacterium sp. MM17-32]|uniref:type VI secretion system Vgr family protein n=1 Tax=Epibacterium sp. MM17-32 TaxID=2917734 RepID=UPI001EF72099|nr:type VI secretion system tip protein TssI/VgrG [Epibacterium sp. MM17-32]MCG7627731.1 type VI secretion system tip protein VgrG [Epibacterium sp. MM17-32]
MNVFVQDARLGRFNTVLGPDALVLLRFDGSEALNELFDFTVEALAPRDDLDFDALLGTHATVTLAGADGPVPFDGIITEVRWRGPGENGWRYDLRLQPWIWLADKRRNQRIFHNKTVVEILQELLADYAHLGSPHLDVALTADYPELEYTVQYRESDLAFARRLMERFGISFSFRHGDGQHTLVLSDDVGSHDRLAQRPYFGTAENRGVQGEHFWSWGPERRLTTGATRLMDYNFKTPMAAMESDRMGDAQYAEGQIEAYDYPGDYLDLGRGKTVAQLRCEEERGHDARHAAAGDIVGLKPGLVVPLGGGDAVPGDGGEHLCLSARYCFVSQAYGSVSSDHSHDRPFTAQYRLMPVAAPMVPPRITPLPIVQGPQTAVVVGEGEIDCDEHGRILVHFHWDLEKAYSMRCRVSQNWASQGWGGMVIPRIGMEVVVEFLEGDPDKPLVTGCVYNGRNKPPYPLPANKTKSVFKTDTHKGSGFNELTFEDERDQELIYMHGQKDQEIVIENDRSKTIGRDESNSIGRDRTQTVGQDETMSVGRDQRETIGQDVTYQVGRDQQEKYGKDHVHVVGNIHKQDIYADHLVQIGRNHEETVFGKSTLNVTESITNNTAKHTLMAFEKFVIKGPGGKITLDASGITLEAGSINLKGAVSMGGSGSAQVPTLQNAARDALPLVEECLSQKE